MRNLHELLDWQTVEDQLVAALQSKLAPGAELKRLFANEPAILLRNWYGQLALLVPCGREELNRSTAIEYLEGLRNHAELLALSDWLICRDELFAADAYWNDPSLIELISESEDGCTLNLLERQDKEGDWLRTSARVTAYPKRLAKRCVFYSIKGGVGRSTALVMMAIHLAKKGKKVLVIDGDFESPGLSSSLLPRDDGQPDYGVVDWLTAHALGADQRTLDEMAHRHLIESSPLNAKLALSGQILVAPAYGKNTQAYVAKLGRIYRTSKEGASYSDRLNLFLGTLEKEHAPDFVFFDSRAGIDDTAAVALTQLQADASFIFAINTAQTWDSYRLLFTHWRRNLSVLTAEEPWSLRESLRVVSALTPQESVAPGYLDDYRGNAYDCFQELYDSDELGTGAEFAPSQDQADAPHHPLVVGITDDLRAFDPLRKPSQVTDSINLAAFSDFLAGAEQMLGVDIQ